MSAGNILIAIGVVIFAYLMGSVNYAVIFSKIFTGGDVRNSGSGNAGATNVLRTAGKLPAILTFAGDILKGFISCLAGKLVFSYLFEVSGGLEVFTPDYGAYLCCVAVMLGHVYPIFFGFKGGKAVACNVGTFAVCCPLAIILGLIGFALVILTVKIVSLGSLIATAIVVGTACIWALTVTVTEYNPLPIIIMALLAGIIIYLKHSANISRLIKGTEPKISAKKREK